MDACVKGEQSRVCFTADISRVRVLPSTSGWLEPRSVEPRILPHRGVGGGGRGRKLEGERKSRRSAPPSQRNNADSGSRARDMFSWLDIDPMIKRRE